jgi:hypothetical protein
MVSYCIQIGQMLATTRVLKRAFGTVALHHDEELAAAINGIDLGETKVELTCDMKHPCNVMNFPLLVLPIHGEEECKLFAHLTLVGCSNDREMAIKWCDYVNGEAIFPKLPVHLRTHCVCFECNERVQAATKAARKKLDLLDDISTTHFARMLRIL